MTGHIVAKRSRLQLDGWTGKSGVDLRAATKQYVLERVRGETLALGHLTGGKKAKRMEDYLARTFDELIGRASGPMKIRLILQPIAASLIAIRAGVKDARESRPLYFWSILHERRRRRELLLEGWKHVGQVFVLAFIIDCVYQIIVLSWFYPGQSVIVALVLAVAPYLIFRGVFHWIWRRRRHGGTSD